MQNFHPNHIRLLVFDIDSLTVNFDQENWDNFRKFLRILDDRDFEIVLISESIEYSDWESYSKLSILKYNTMEALQKNNSLTGNDVFWFTELPELQTKLSENTHNFGGSSAISTRKGGMQYQYLHDMLHIFHPSKITAADLTAKLFKIKQKSPQVPLLIGIGGPDDCGHDFFVSELIEALEDQGMLVSGLDLSQVLGTEFQNSNMSGNKSKLTLWRSEEIQDWIVEVVMRPYSKGQQVYFEKIPEIIHKFEITTTPFFLDPEMILVVWGTTVFLPEMENLIDVRVLLDLSEKTAAARMFSLDERENFDQSFVETYLKKEGKYYSDYLDQFKVYDRIDFLIDFNNFNAFRMKKPS